MYFPPKALPLGDPGVSPLRDDGLFPLVETAQSFTPAFSMNM